MSAEKVITIAKGEVGYLEKKTNAYLNEKTTNAGYNNYTKYGLWAGCNGQPWCDAFVSWCADQAGESEAVGKYVYVPSHIAFFKRKGQYFARGAKTPQPGDVIFFGDEAHVGYVEYVSGGYVHTIEGNTSGGSTLVANGGGVHQKSYPLTSSYIMGYGRPAYNNGYTIGWHETENGWWYAYSSTNYYKNQWGKIDGEWYYFNDKGYAVYDCELEYEGKVYVFDHDGHAKLKETPKEEEPEMPDVKVEKRYYYLKELTEADYRPTVDKLIEKKILKGKGGSGEDLILDMGEDSIRLLVILDRAGAFNG